MRNPPKATRSKRFSSALAPSMALAPRWGAAGVGGLASNLHVDVDAATVAQRHFQSVAHQQQGGLGLPREDAEYLAETLVTTVPFVVSLPNKKVPLRGMSCSPKQLQQGQHDRVVGLVLAYSLPKDAGFVRKPHSLARAIFPENGSSIRLWCWVGV